MTPPTQNDRNAAHSGPVFLPWHRLMLLLFELQIQRVLNDATIGLPYWDWAADGALPPSGQVGSPLWQNSGIGGTGRPVSNGPFQANVFLNHCNVDRIWEAWLVNQGRTYVPSQSESAQLAMHRLNDPMYSIS